MPIDWKAFSFVPDWEKLHSSDSFVAHLPAGISDEGAMFDALAKAVNFPEYFGKNWNAVLDCLRDLTWIQQRDVILVHADVPSLTPESLDSYLDVLSEAIKAWPAGDQHRLLVYFPVASDRDLRLRVASTVRPPKLQS